MRKYPIAHSPPIPGVAPLLPSPSWISWERSAEKLVRNILVPDRVLIHVALLAQLFTVPRNDLRCRVGPVTDLAAFRPFLLNTESTTGCLYCLRAEFLNARNELLTSDLPVFVPHNNPLQLAGIIQRKHECGCHLFHNSHINHLLSAR